MAMEQMSLYYRPSDYDASMSRIYGRVSANANLLSGLIQYGRRPSLSFYVEENAHFEDIKQRFKWSLQAAKKIIQPIFHGDVFSLKQASLYVSTDPMLAQSAWVRSVLAPTAYSLCGLTHSISSYLLLEEIAKLILAPIMPWDTIICTSHAVKNALEILLQQWVEYLKKYRQLDYQFPLQLPVIPLGIHVNEVSCLEKKEYLRKKFRATWNIKANDFVVLFYGRLSYYEKSHPAAMYLVLEELAKRIKNTDKIYYIQAGWFPEKKDFAQYKKLMRELSPSIKPIFLLDPDHAAKLAMWSGADVFVSLVDNIQETFGLTPLEAMANELPVVVTDWDGYKETVRDGVDGFRIPSLLPPQGCGVDLGLAYVSQAINY
ncbi:MAG: glycosyltransferase family 4 protein, partial [Gammaproteobacteria bacterium]|nr:glycosyltransferase family 4 protein [Gammaproteobacteria bacterium]